jgi:NADH-quinone oxidoreductase subunit H
VAAANIGIVRFVIAATAILLISIPIAFINIFAEMKVIAFMNSRIGPNRIGPWGTLQSVVHGLKVLAKEDFTPLAVDRSAFTIAPIVVFLSVVLTFLVLPFAPGLFGADMNVGLLYFFAIGGLGVVGMLMAGWASFNKYSLLGGLRAAAQIVSYEIPLTLSVVGLVMLAGTMSLNQIVLAQSGHFWNWYVFQQPLAFIIFFIAATAEGNRTPFDLTEADSEIVAGFATEYSGMRFGFFFFAEYVNVFILSALMVTLFMGGWNAPIDIHPILNWLNITLNPAAIDPGSLGLGLLLLILFGVPLLILFMTLIVWMIKSSWSFLVSLIVAFVLFNVLAIGISALWAYMSFDAISGLFWFVLKTFTFAFIFVWMRGTLPRVRIDQLMGWAWKWLVEIALLNIFVTAGAILILDSLAERSSLGALLRAAPAEAPAERRAWLRRETI